MFKFVSMRSEVVEHPSAQCLKEEGNNSLTPSSLCSGWDSLCSGVINLPVELLIITSFAACM